MFAAIGRKLFGTKNERYLKTLGPVVDQVNSLEDKVRAFSDADFPSRIAELRQQVEAGKSTDELLPEVFALVREAGRRQMNMRHYDVQLIGGAVLHGGRIAEMRTGEGKTLVATLPVVLNALSGKGVHVVTVNDYLARRDAEWMSQIYTFLGLSVGTVLHGMTDEERKAAYGADITYGTNNEFGFDYLRDNMKFYLDQLVQRDLHFAIVDEVDSILIDEARTPLIISGQAQDSVAMYAQMDSIIPRLNPENDFILDEKARTVSLTDEGVIKCENILGISNLYDPANIAYQHHVLQALKAHRLFKRDVDYVVKEGQVMIVDEFTGRLMEGRRYSDGLHQALEAKEHVKVEAENQTLASITFQNYFRMYDKLSGMTGTADTEAVEFKQIYDLDVTVIPTNRPMVRNDQADLIFKNQDAKYRAIAEDVTEKHKEGRPVLVGTTSIEKSERLSSLLKKRRVPHSVLNAKHHEQEAEIVAEAGQTGKVTIATNMAGRGTDIVLGEGVRELGGLHILGTERHESRRIDNQLRGRSGRQGDPGSSRFFLALDDDLMRLFGSEKLQGIMNRLGLEDDEAIENSMVTKAIENAQRRVEGRNFDIRKQLLEFDDTMNQQRTVIYSQRRDIMRAQPAELEEMVNTFVDEQLDGLFESLEHSKSRHGDEEEATEFVAGRLDEIFNLGRVDELREKLPTRDAARDAVNERFGVLRQGAPDMYTEIFRFFLLDSLDRNWKEHLLNMDYLREGIGLRGYGQKDPKQEYKREGFELFQDMLERIKETTLRSLCRLRLQQEVHEDDFQHQEEKNVTYAGGGESEAAKKKPMKREEPKVGRNDPCPCGSGKKYKKCCGR
ncbi:preprotein translocase subunit SecA [Desulfobaculum bizertense]|uniref:Protein translocase subunit SecA n=1 Tax=Desulfobaculum bizertense DSM 18034 TaxID=1121442 RepID=A0A1T4VJ37_9BACT|nr:preprotein translocase subunit SecA [Desulfobaculum bizertense]UIJ37890.1 preprotein translocase subunit SecA [Desulfobaculum bizertense]SKA64601.1 protein translocase subunit secA [Desulfobaculum bizertense DSM 18034]